MVFRKDVIVNSSRISSTLALISLLVLKFVTNMERGQVPLERLCLETDDSPDDIKSMYGTAAAILKIDEAALLEIMNHNFESIFRKTNDR